MNILKTVQKKLKYFKIELMKFILNLQYYKLSCDEKMLNKGFFIIYFFKEIKVSTILIHRNPLFNEAQRKLVSR